jgi:antitoxin component HigA of HigAB toxin-antitoxin module
MIRTTIETEEEYRKCLERLDEIFDSKPGDPNEKEAVALAVMVQGIRRQALSDRQTEDMTYDEAVQKALQGEADKR